MKQLILLGASLLAVAARPALAQTNAPEVVVVKITEANSMAYLRIIVARGEGKTEETILKNRALGGTAGAAEASQKVLAKLYAEGYTLKATYGGGDRVESHSTLILVKGQ